MATPVVWHHEALPWRRTIHAVNLLDRPDAVAVKDRGNVGLLNGGYTFPAHSITVLTFTLA